MKVNRNPLQEYNNPGGYCYWAGGQPKIDASKLTSVPKKVPRKTPATYPKNHRNTKHERISFINRWLRVWGMFQGGVGVFLEHGKIMALYISTGGFLS